MTNNIINIDETKLNHVMKTVRYGTFKKIINKRLPTPNKQVVYKQKKITPTVRKIINILKLEDEPNYDERVTLFIIYCRHYSKNTMIRYFQEAKYLGLFGDSKIVPEYNNFIGKQHIRIVDPSSYIKFISYLKAHFNEFNAPMLIAYYTGLRVMEILQFSMNTLYQLSIRQVYINIIRKTTLKTYESEDDSKNYWKPVYNPELYKFIDDLISLYKDSYNEFLRNKKLNQLLFYIKPNTVVARMKTQYFNVIGKPLPYGFGIHGYRTTMATILSESTKNLPAIKHYLQHKNIQTTLAYIKIRWSEMEKEFDRLTKLEYSKISSLLKSTITDDLNEKFNIDRNDGTDEDDF